MAEPRTGAESGEALPAPDAGDAAPGAEAGETVVQQGPPTPPTSRPPLLLAAAAISAVQAIAVAGYAVLIGIFAARTGSVLAAAPIEVTIYLLFAFGIALVTKGLLSRRRISRAPYVLTQIFGLIAGWTLVSGDGTDVHVYGWLALVSSLAGIALIMNRQVGDALVR
jgi:peptidoglycan/LPS O-acetylase OafA/YrhL